MHDSGLSGCGEGDYWGGQAGACLFKVPETFRARKDILCLLCLHSISKFHNFESNTMKLSVNEAKLTGLWARNCDTIQQVVILIFVFGPENFPGLSRNGPKVKGSKSF